MLACAYINLEILVGLNYITFIAYQGVTGEEILQNITLNASARLPKQTNKKNGLSVRLNDTASPCNTQ